MIKRTDKHFTIQRKNCDEVVSIDRLKSAYMGTSVTSDPSSTMNTVTATIPEITHPHSRHLELLDLDVMKAPLLTW